MTILHKHSVITSKAPIVLAALLAAMIIPEIGFCADGTDASLDKMTTSVISTIFAPWVKKSALAFGAGFGLFQSYMGGSVKPLLSWGGLGLAVNYVPNLIEYISKIGA